MKQNIKGLYEILRDSFINFNKDKCLKFSAALAYYTIFSIAPMLIIIIYLVGLFYGQEAIQGEIYNQINELVGKEAAFQIQEIIKNSAKSKSGMVATTIGLVTLFIGATGVFSEIQDSINTIWGLKPKPQKGLLTFIINRLLSFSMVVSLGFLLLVSLVINALLGALNSKLHQFFPEITIYVFQVINLVLTFGVVTFLFAIIYKMLPDAVIKWKDVWVGSMTTAVLFIGGKSAIGYYLGQSDVGSTFGAAGSIIIILIWVNYSSVILYFGAEFTQCYAMKWGSRIYPNKYAEWVKHKELSLGKGAINPKDTGVV